MQDDSVVVGSQSLQPEGLPGDDNIEIQPASAGRDSGVGSASSQPYGLLGDEIAEIEPVPAGRDSSSRQPDGLRGDEIDEIQPSGPRLQKCAITGCPGRIPSYNHTCNVCSLVVHALCSQAFLEHITINDSCDYVCIGHAEQQLPLSRVPPATKSPAPAGSSPSGTSSYRRGNTRGTRRSTRSGTSTRRGTRRGTERGSELGHSADAPSRDQTQDSDRHSSTRRRKNNEGNLEKINELESQLGDLAEIRLVLPNDSSRHLEAFLECVGLI